MRFAAVLLALAVIHAPAVFAQAGSEGFTESFEFTDLSGSFTRGTDPFTVTFNGGQSISVGNGAFYHTGAFSWGSFPNGASNGEFLFNTPARMIDFFWRPQSGADTGNVEMVDTDGTVVATFNPTPNVFTRVTHEIGAGELPLASMRINQTAGPGVLWIDTFTYRPFIDQQQNIDINLGIAGTWTSNAQGQGLLIDVIDSDNPPRQELFVAWFTHDINAPTGGDTGPFGSNRNRWFTAQGPFVGDTAMLTLFVTDDGIFNDPRPTTTTAVGTFEATFQTCDEGIVDFDFTDLAISGQFTINRLIPNTLCEDLLAQ